MNELAVNRLKKDIEKYVIERLKEIYWGFPASAAFVKKGMEN